MKQTPRELLDAAARLKIPDDVNLFPRIAARFERKSILQTLRTKPILLGLSILFSLAVVTGVAYAVGRSLGYIHGVGMVENEQTVRILSGETKISSNGFSLFVRSLTADSAQTLVSYRIMGFPRELARECEAAPFLQLPDGVQLQSINTQVRSLGGVNYIDIYSLDMRATFPPIPAGVNEVSFLAPCHLPPVQLQLVPAPQGMVLSATEIPITFEVSRPVLPTPTKDLQTTPAQIPAGSQSSPLAPSSYASGLKLDKVIEVNDTYILQGTFTDAGDLPGRVIRLNEIPSDMRVTDRNNQYVPAWVRPELIPNGSQGNIGYWALEIPRAVEAPVTLTLSKITLLNENTFSFPLDIGEAPFDGQTWAINQIIRSGRYAFLVEAISRSKSGYTVSFHSLTPITQENFSCNFVIEGYPVSSSYENFHERNGISEWSETQYFKGQVPVGKIIFSLEVFTTFEAGPWILTWSPENP
jgi:hypothetical protein